MPQFLIEPENIHDNHASLSGEEARHLTKVLRYKKGDTLWVSDGQNRWRACIENITPKGAVLKLLEKQTLQAPAVSPALAIALLKKDHLEWVIQKGVELGCAEFFLFTSQRTIPHLTDRAEDKKTTRLEKIALEAAKQSGMIGRPLVRAPITFASLLEKFSPFDAVFLAWEEETRLNFRAAFRECGTRRVLKNSASEPVLAGPCGGRPNRLGDPTTRPAEQEGRAGGLPSADLLRRNRRAEAIFQQPAQKVLLVVGPEGGFAKEEAKGAVQAGGKTISLGSQILRSETAAITLLSLCQYELGNI